MEITELPPTPFVLLAAGDLQHDHGAMIGESGAVTRTYERLCRCRSGPSAALAASVWPSAAAQLASRLSAPWHREPG